MLGLELGDLSDGQTGLEFSPGGSCSRLSESLNCIIYWRRPILIRTSSDIT